MDTEAGAWPGGQKRQSGLRLAPAYRYFIKHRLCSLPEHGAGWFAMVYERIHVREADASFPCSLTKSILIDLSRKLKLLLLDASIISGATEF